MAIHAPRLLVHNSRWVLMLFMVPGVFFMIPGFVLWFFMVPGQFISELSARGAKPDVENTPKGTRLTFILAPRSRLLGLADCRPALA